MFHTRLRETRIKHKLTQQKTADALGIALRSYQCYETGSRWPPLDMLVKIGNLFDTSIDYLLGRDDFLKSIGVDFDKF